MVPQYAVDFPSQLSGIIVQVWQLHPDNALGHLYLTMQVHLLSDCAAGISHSSTVGTDVLNSCPVEILSIRSCGSLASLRCLMKKILCWVFLTTCEVQCQLFWHIYSDFMVSTISTADLEVVSFFSSSEVNGYVYCHWGVKEQVVVPALLSQT